MPDVSELLRTLQHGDSFFPSGGVAFSWGLEALRNDGVVASRRDVGAFVAGQLRSRWARVDRPVLVAAYRAGPDLAKASRIDRLLDALTLPRTMREGSRRAGLALLGVHERLATPGAGSYYGMVRQGGAPGHLAVAQGLVWRAVGLSEEDAAAISGHGFVVGVLGAAVRLGLIGHIASQQCLAATREVVVGILATPPLALHEIGAFTPQADIAAMRHETGTARLFAT